MQQSPLKNSRDSQNGGEKLIDHDKAPRNEPGYTTGLPLVVTLSSLVLAVYLMLLDTSIVSTAIPRITTTFHSLNDVGWYGTAYLVTNCAVQPLSGKLYTYFNSRWTFLAFFTVFELGSAICGAAQSSNMLIVGRALAGIGSSGLLNGAFTILHASVPAERLPQVTGVLMGLSQLGLLSGPLIGGALTQHASWRWCFYINLPCAAIIYPALFLIRVPNHRAHSIKAQPLRNTLLTLDPIGFILFAGAIVQLLFALNWGGTSYAWASAIIIGLFAGSAATFLLFLVWEYRMGESAMIPFALARRRIIWSSCLSYGLTMGAIICCTYYLPMYFQAVRGSSPTGSGVSLLPSIAPNIVFAMAAGVLVGRLGYYLPFSLLGASLTTTGTALLTTLTPTTSTARWVSFQVLQGIGRGLSIQMPLHAVTHDAPAGTHSIATGLVVLSQNLGGAVFLSLCQVVFSTGLNNGLGQYAPGVDAVVVEAAGASGVRDVVGRDSGVLDGVLRAYNGAIMNVMYVATAAAAGSLVFACGMGWVNVNGKKGKAEEGAQMGQGNSNTD
ncbi:hypothetical protein BDW74DRAFT_167766 [Aspergillus multicolor]|uniref:uncharacterized protein n=1 Tax=Aspergillus multicolor TaxID=41759 RepID=UPI003CCD3852